MTLLLVIASPDLSGRGNLVALSPPFRRKACPALESGPESTFHVIPISPVIAVKTAIQLDNLVIEVPPCRINLLNQLKLPFSLPFLNRLLARDSALH